MRHKKPTFLIEIEKMKEPKCCHTCWSYDERGTCVIFRMNPPEDFAQSLDQCEEWELNAPF